MTRKGTRALDHGSSVASAVEGYGDLVEKVGAGITYGCREGECCTCTVKVVSGMEHMSERSVLEDKVLQENMAGRNDRLACQAQVLGGDIVVKA